MTHTLIKVLSCILLVLICIAIFSELMNEFDGFSTNKVEIETITRFKKEFGAFFTLNSNMDIIRQQNSDIVPPREFDNFTAHELCNNTDLCVRSFMKHETRYKVAPDYKMIQCVVHKSMSTVMTGIMCYLYNRERFLKVDKQMNMSEWEKSSLCHNDNSYRTFGRVLNKFNISSDLEDWSLSMITRNPVERFVSGYVDRCVRVAEGPKPCNGCDKNMTCFILSEYARFQKQIRKHSLTNTFEDRHFYPQNWRCDLKKNHEKYEFIRYSSDPSKELMTDLFKIGKRQGVPDNELECIRNELTKNRKTSHTTVYTPAREFYEKRLRENPLLMEYVVRMFYHDFVILNYPFPNGF